MDRNQWISLDFIDFNDFSLTLRRCSSELSKSFLMFGRVFNMYVARSLRLAPPYSVRFAGLALKLMKRSEFFQDFQDPGH